MICKGVSEFRGLESECIPSGRQDWCKKTKKRKQKKKEVEREVEEGEVEEENKY